MELDFSWALIGLPLVFALGWLASRFDFRQLQIDNRTQPKAYFKGLNHLLNEQQDEAIDAFIEAVQKDPDTTELHFALGNLFRRRGEFERAVRVHEHLLSRADLSSSDQQRARHALAQDFLRAGLLDRAETNLKFLLNSPLKAQALFDMLIIHERTRDWKSATQVAQELAASGEGHFEVRQAHYICEQALVMPRGPERLNLLQQACQTAPQAARPLLAMAQELQAEGQTSAALQRFLELAQSMPNFIPLFASDLVKLAQAEDRTSEVRALLLTHSMQYPSLDVTEALVELDRELGQTEVQTHYARHLSLEPSLVAARQWLALEPLRDESQRQPLERALNLAVQPLWRYRCAACGFEARKHFWHCPGCQAWDSYPPRRVEEL